MLGLRRQLLTLEPDAAFDDCFDTQAVGDTSERVSGQHHEVGKFTNLQRAQISLQAQYQSGVSGRKPQHLVVGSPASLSNASSACSPSP